VTDPVLLVLGGAVVKTAVRLWVGPNLLADNLTADLTGLLESRVSDAGERRKLRRRFEEMEDIVADQVLNALEVEFRDLDEGERAAAITAVTQTFNRARLTDQVLFEGNLDPLYLEKFVRRYTGDATRDLSYGGEALFDRVLAQCCAYIIEIADKLPRFQAGAFTELLRRDSQILARLEEVLTRLPVPSRDGTATDRIETAYRQRIARLFDRLELFGLDFAAQWYSLSIAYVNLSVFVRQNSAEAQDNSFEQWLTRCPRLIINGRAGGGKTTILQWIAVRSARRDFTGPAARFNGYVPFFIRLREFTAGMLPQPEEFLDRVASLLAPENRAWPREQLTAGRAFVLIDGVDEVPESRRPAVFAWLRELTELFPAARYVVTTRPSAVDEDALDDMDFTEAELNPMDPALTERFIERWHDAMREWQKDSASQVHLGMCLERLMLTVQTDQFVRDLANTPLLAGLLCAINQHLDGHLPGRRGEIFEKALAMFYERDRKRGITSAVRLDLDATYHLLGDLALWMVRNSVVEVSAQSARDILGRSALSLPGVSSSGAELYRHLLLRSGLLREPVSEHVDFVHRAFQEFLAARALIATDNVGEIIKNAGDDQWREIVILAAGVGNLRQSTDLLRGLLRPTWRGRNRYRRRLLAVASLDEIRGAEPDALRDAERAISELVPPRTFDEAELLSRAGQRVLPYLARDQHLADEKAYPLVVRVLSLIGGGEALYLIESITRANISMLRTSDIDSLGELDNAMEYFDFGLFTEKVVSQFELKEVSIGDPRLLPVLGKLTTVRDVTLRDFVTDDTDLSVLDLLPVEVLQLADCKIRSLAGLIRPWPGVRRVALFSCPDLLDISALSVLPKMDYLRVDRCEKIRPEDLAQFPVEAEYRGTGPDQPPE
jgi:NACHT domain